MTLSSAPLRICNYSLEFLLKRDIQLREKGQKERPNAFMLYSSGSQNFFDSTHLNKTLKTCDASGSILRFCFPVLQDKSNPKSKELSLYLRDFVSHRSTSIVKLRSSEMVAHLSSFCSFYK